MCDLNNDLIERLIPKYQGMFRILEKWDIQFEDDGFYGDQCWHNNKTKVARIYPVTVETDIGDYVFHELLHICQSELKSGGYKKKREKEELFVQDLCKIMYESKSYK